MAYVTGPEKHGKQWRVRIEYGRKTCACCGKRRHDVYFPDEASAQRDAEILRRELSGELSLEWALSEYLGHLRDVRKVSNAHLYKTESRLRAMLDGKETKTVSWLNPERAGELYLFLVERTESDTTQLNTLSQCRGWFRWLCRKGHAESNPWDAVDPVGKRTARAREQALSDDEAGKLYRWCMDRGELDATITALALTLGMRAGEIAGIGPNDLDSGGSIIVVRKGKTEAAKRKLRVPPWLVGRVEAIAAAELDRFAVNRAVRRATSAAGVTVVGPHALRATCASVAESAGAPWQAFGPALGHTGPAVTHGHYIRPGASESARAELLERKLGVHGPKSAPSAPSGEKKDE